jgi:hypothetical protein
MRKVFSLSAPLLLLIVISIVGCNFVQTIGNQNDHTQELQRQAALVLAEAFETVVRTGADLLSDSASYRKVPTKVRGELRIPYFVFKDGLDSIDQQLPRALLEESAGVLIGASEFRAPIGLGPVFSRKCYVVVLKNRSEFHLPRFLSKAEMHMVSGFTVWSWVAKLGEFGELSDKLSTLHTVQIGSSFVLLSNDVESLASVAVQLTSLSPTRQIDPIVSHWDELRKYEYWAYRRFRHNQVVDLTAAGLTYITPEARSLIFLFDRKNLAFTLRLSCVPGEEDTAANINGTGLFGRLKWRPGGIWEKTIPIAEDVESLERIGSILSMLGFGVYI